MVIMSEKPARLLKIQNIMIRTACRVKFVAFKRAKFPNGLRPPTLSLSKGFTVKLALQKSEIILAVPKLKKITQKTQPNAIPCTI